MGNLNKCKYADNIRVIALGTTTFRGKDVPVLRAIDDELWKSNYWLAKKLEKETPQVPFHVIIKHTKTTPTKKERI